jgi:(5-formylfuran-3-yl)methyl phosphate synthase
VGDAAPVSVALGDLPNLPHTAALAARGAALSGADYVKVGLRGVRELNQAVTLIRAVADAVRVGGDRVSVIAAAYADADALDPPALAPAALPALVDRTGIAGALVDTFRKDGRGLYAWLSESELTELIIRTRAAGASFALAGQLTRADLCRVAADVVGVRSAVCHGGDRAAELDAELVAAAVAQLNRG